MLGVLPALSLAGVSEEPPLQAARDTATNTVKGKKNLFMVV